MTHTVSSFSTNRNRHIAAYSHTRIVNTSELDPHADTSYVGRNALILYTTEQHVTVTPFHSSLGSLDQVPIIHAAVAHDHFDGQPYILLLNQVLHFPDMDHNLICPMQCMMKGVDVDARPKFLSPIGSDERHSIYFPNEDVRIPLDLTGVTSTFVTRKPTLQEVHELQNLTMTYDELEWDPHHRRFQEQEEAMTDHVGHALEPLDHQSKENRFVNSFATSKPRAENTARYKSKVCAVLSDISNTLNDDTFVKALKENVNLSSSQTTGRAT